MRPMDERAAEGSWRGARGASPTRGSAERRRAHAPRVEPNPRPGGRQANASCQAGRAVERGRRFAPPCTASEAVRRRHTRLKRTVLTPGLASLARRERPTRLHAAGSRPAWQPDGHRRAPLVAHVSPLVAHVSPLIAHVSPLIARCARSSAGREPGWRSSWQASRLPAACKRFGHAARPTGRRAGRPSALLASADGCGPRPLGRRQGPPRAKRASASARASEGGEVWRRRAASEAAQGASVASDRVHPATSNPTVGSACRPPGLGFGRGSGRASFGRAPARWRRSRSSGADVSSEDERAAESLAAVDELDAPSTAPGAARAVPARHGARPNGAALMPRERSRTQDQEDDRRTRLARRDEP